MGEAAHPHALLSFYENACGAQQVAPIDSLRQKLQDCGDACRPLETLALKGVPLSNRRQCWTVAELIKVNPFLTSVNLQETDLQDKGCVMVCDAIAQQKNVVRLDLSYNGIEKEGGKAVATLMTKLPGLRVVDVTGNLLNAAMAPSLKPALLSSSLGLQMLRLGDNDLTSSGLQALCEGLKANATIRNLHLPDNKIDARMAQHIAGVLSNNTTITNMDLRYNKLSDHGAAALATAMRANRVLLGLVLWGNEIHDQGMSSLALMLAENSTLQSLDVGLNPIGVEAAEVLKKALPRNRSLTTLGMASTEIGNEGAVALAEALEGSRTLLHLDLRRNGIAMAGVMALHLAMKLNTTLCTLALVSSDDPKIDDVMELEMRKAIDEICQVNAKANPIVQQKLKAQQANANHSKPQAAPKEAEQARELEKEDKKTAKEEETAAAAAGQEKPKQEQGAAAAGQEKPKQEQGAAAAAAAAQDTQAAEAEKSTGNAGGDDDAANGALEDVALE